MKFQDERFLQDKTPKHKVTFQDCVFRDNYVDSSMSFPGIIENSYNSELVVSNCLFQNNVYGDDQNPASYGYAIRSFGPISLDSTCFIDNVFLNHGPVLVYGNQYSASNNYVESEQEELTCEFLALFNEQDDRADETPSCEMSDADVCAFVSPPTEAPTEGEATPAPSTLIEDFIEDQAPPSATITTTATAETPSSAGTTTTQHWNSLMAAQIFSSAVWFIVLQFQ